MSENGETGEIWAAKALWILATLVIVIATSLEQPGGLTVKALLEFTPLEKSNPTAVSIGAESI